MACEISGQLSRLESPDPQTLTEGLIGRTLPEIPLQWMEDHPDLAEAHPDPPPMRHTSQSLAELAASHPLLVYLTPSEARERDEDTETMGRVYRDHDEDIYDLGVLVVGVSTQPLTEQHEIAVQELYPQTLFRDEHLVLARELKLPVTIHAATVEYQPLVLIVKEGVIAHVIYPINSPQESAAVAVAWLTKHAGGADADGGRPARERSLGGEGE